MEVTLAVTCDYANVSQEGKLNILGVSLGVEPPFLPYQVPQLYLVISFEAGPAEFGTQKDARIALLESDGTEMLALEGPIPVERPDRPGSRAHINQVVALEGLAFEKSGDYAFHILVNGEEKRTVPYYVNEPQQQLPPQGG